MEVILLRNRGQRAQWSPDHLFLTILYPCGSLD